MATIYKASGEEIEVKPKNGRHFQLDELQGIVGGYIEVIQHIGSRNLTMVFNEEGKMKGLPSNPGATLFAVLMLNPGDEIVGDALVCKNSEIK